MLAVALDPGITTGIAKAYIEDERIIRIEAGQGHFSTLQLWGLLETTQPAYIIAEKFDYRNDSRPGLELFSRNLLGVSEVWASLHDCRYHTQSASEGFSFWTDEKLRKAGCYRTGSQHPRDATRHLLYWLTFKRGATLWKAAADYPYLEQFATPITTGD